MTAPGTLMAGRYRLVERIAAGGMGSVWEAWDELLHRRVAVKQLLPQPGVSAEDAEMARRRLIREARITARLHHPHVVTLYDVVQHDDCPCLIMQYVPSRSLNAVLQERGVLPEATVLRLGAELAAGLAAAHEVGIVHRDVKPGNVLITEDGAAKLTDFGISHAVGDANLTATGMVTGTPSYLAPEVARGGAAGFPADVFSFGATLYAALEGTPPFGTDPNPMAILHRVASGQMIPPRRSGSLTPVLLAMLTPEPGERPTMAEVARMLAARQAAGSTGAELLHGPTVVLPPQTVREWPAGTAPLPPGPWQGLVRGEAPADHPEPEPDPDDSVESPLLPLSAPASSTRAPRRPAAARDRRWLRPALAALVAVLVAGAVILVLTRTRGDGSADGADPTTTTGTSTVETSASTAGSEPSGGVAPPPVSDTSQPSPAEVGESTAPVDAGEPVESTPAPSSSAPSSSAPTAETSTSTESSVSTESSTSTESSPEVAGAPTADELAGFVTDYYSRLPGDTDQGWERLTEGFQTGIARNRANYGNFWGGIDRVEVADVDATPPGTVEATVTYYFADGQVSEERTRYTLVRADDSLKIDSSTVLSSRSP
ncbi:serine/threonine-protein kinase [Nakamurella deserti]|uniref:serine/threonine-protein kinase n=1 Tax=Nakamurella deserti TaxID=2164074 RepID=UPI001300AE28|nr:serine/threonine-protein kinase [Nakamurella deserti]